MSFDIQGGRNLAKRLELNALAGVALRNFFSAYGQLVVTTAKKEAPRFSGDLRGSLTFKHVRGAGGLPEGIDVFSRADHALFVHGFYDDKHKLSKPWSRTKPHWPPKKALQGWADAKGIPVYLVQKSISEKGTPIIPFFKIAIKKNEAQKKVLLKGTGVKITATWKASRRLPKGTLGSG
tara:strand:+ start:996 stop:1532 length:537 start_codon:yes stop_codon:yes gene_type:complete